MMGFMGVGKVKTNNRSTASKNGDEMSVQRPFTLFLLRRSEDVGPGSAKNRLTLNFSVYEMTK